jgi:protein phosphatase
VGTTRSSNEDSLLALEIQLSGALEKKTFGLFAVADGMGGCEGGEIASALALRAFIENTVRSFILPGTRGCLSVSNREFTLKALTEGIQAANHEILNEARARRNEMGTTLAAALVLGGSVYIANVGDSRVYLLEGDELRQVTTDHSLVAALVSEGKISREQIYTHPQRNVITRCLGTAPNVKMDVFIEELKPRHSLLICSDGLWEMVRDSEIKAALLQSRHPQEACDELVKMANQGGGTDNISVIVVKRRDTNSIYEQEHIKESSGLLADANRII